VNANLKRFSNDQLEHINEHARELISRFRYTEAF